MNSLPVLSYTHARTHTDNQSKKQSILKENKRNVISSLGHQ